MSEYRDETMMLKTPFHSRIEAVNELNEWDGWAGYTTPVAYTNVRQPRMHFWWSTAR